MGVIEQLDMLLDSGLGHGTRLLLRNKRLLDGPSTAPSLLFVHGATYAASLVFDYDIDGQSWMDRLARAGFDVWCVDLPGYGGAERPPAMAYPTADHPPLTTTAEAEAATLRAVRHILESRGVPRLHLIGYSWGTAICGGLAAAHPELVDRLVLLGALWTGVTGRTVNTTADGLAAHRDVDAAAASARWVINLEPAQIAAIVPPGRIDAWVANTLASDGGLAPAGELRVPAGVVADIQRFWLNGKPTYDPRQITAPSLVVMGEWDHETTPAQGWEVFQRLTAASIRRYVVIGCGTHSLPLENEGPTLFAEVELFLTA